MSRGRRALCSDSSWKVLKPGASMKVLPAPPIQRAPVVTHAPSVPVKPLVEDDQSAPMAVGGFLNQTQVERVMWHLEEEWRLPHARPDTVEKGREEQCINFTPLTLETLGDVVRWWMGKLRVENYKYQACSGVLLVHGNHYVAYKLWHTAGVDGNLLLDVVVVDSMSQPAVTKGEISSWLKQHGISLGQLTTLATGFQDFASEDTELNRARQNSCGLYAAYYAFMLASLTRAEAKSVKRWRELGMLSTCLLRRFWVWAGDKKAIPPEHLLGPDNPLATAMIISSFP